MFSGTLDSFWFPIQYLRKLFSVTHGLFLVGCFMNTIQFSATAQNIFSSSNFEQSLLGSFYCRVRQPLTKVSKQLLMVCQTGFVLRKFLYHLLGDIYVRQFSVQHDTCGRPQLGITNLDIDLLKLISLLDYVSSQSKRLTWIPILPSHLILAGRQHENPI